MLAGLDSIHSRHLDIQKNRVELFVRIGQILQSFDSRDGTDRRLIPKLGHHFRQNKVKGRIIING